MDVAYNQHAQHTRRKNRSSINLNHLSLAPLTSKLPLTDPEELPDDAPRPQSSQGRPRSYIEGKSAPTTPGVLSRSSSRVTLRRSAGNGLMKSKSSVNFLDGHKSPRSGFPRDRGVIERGNVSPSALFASDQSDSQWLLRTGALIATGARESKGQAWLVSRASSTSLTGQVDEDEEELERQLASERASRRTSRRGSMAADADDEYSPVTTRASWAGSKPNSRYGSRAASRAHSRRGSRGQLFTPFAMTEKTRDSYFPADDDAVAAPDFVDAEEEVYEEQQAAEDEVIVKQLAKKGTLGLGVWVEKLMGWSLFAVEEDTEDSDAETAGEKADTDVSDTTATDSTRRRSRRPLTEESDAALNEMLPPPNAEEGGWQDAAWLLSVASKVLL